MNINEDALALLSNLTEASRHVTYVINIHKSSLPHCRMGILSNGYNI